MGAHLSTRQTLMTTRKTTAARDSDVSISCVYRLSIILTSLVRQRVIGRYEVSGR